MKSNIKSILNKVEKTNSKNNEEIVYDRRTLDLLERIEEEKNKTEETKQHERFLRYIKRKSTAVEIETQKAKPQKIVKGTFFEGTISVLLEKYNHDLDEVFDRMTSGQLLKYSIKNDKIINIKTGNVVYDIKEKIIYEE